MRLLKRLCYDAVYVGAMATASVCSAVVDAHATLFPSPKELKRRARIERRRLRREKCGVDGEVVK